MGIPKAPPSRPKSPPARPGPPIRPPLPTTPKHAPKAGVISIVKTEQGILRPVIADSSGAAQSMPHRPAPPVAAAAAAAKTYQEPEQQLDLSRKSSSSSSSTSSPIQEAPQKTSPPQSLSIHDQDTGAIYEEIDDDVVSISIPKK